MSLLSLLSLASVENILQGYNLINLLKIKIMVKVYFETSVHAELAAVFESEDIYMACLPTLEKIASDARMIVSESVDELSINDMIKK